MGGVWLLMPACSSHRPSFYSPDRYGAHALDALIAKSPPPPGQNVTVTELEHSASSSVSVVQIRDREQPHIHGRYDLTVVMAQGEGTLWLNGTPIRMSEGDAAFIPRGTAHYFVNQGSEPAAAIVVFAPAFSGPDQQPVP
jgi:quercetin dioxygenase-like cupin family protein